MKTVKSFTLIVSCSCFLLISFLATAFAEKLKPTTLPSIPKSRQLRKPSIPPKNARVTKPKLRVFLENRDAKKYNWKLKCGKFKREGFIKADEELTFQQRLGMTTVCMLGLRTQQKMHVLQTGQRWILRQGRLVLLSKRTILFPDIPVLGYKGFKTSKRKLQFEWAIHGYASSEYSTTSWNAFQIIGPANTKQCSDSSSAWATLKENAGTEWIVATFSKVRKAVGVYVHVNLNPGAIVKIEAKINGSWVPVWHGKDPSKGVCPSVASLKFNETVQTKSIRIVLNTKLVSGWNEIDAVQLISVKGK